MWLSKLRQRPARGLPATAIAAASARLTAIELVMYCRASHPTDALLNITALPCRLSVAACGRGAGDADAGDVTALAALSDGFSYRAMLAQVDPSQGYGKTLSVAKGRDFSTISIAVGAAQTGDISSIPPGTYAGEGIIIVRDDSILRGKNGITTLAAAHRPLLQNKAILTTHGRNLLLENLELKGAFSTARNGAAIRAEGLSLHVWNYFIHDNQAGILVANRRDSTVLVEYSEFARNAHREGQAHQIYAGLIAQLRLRDTFIHDSFVGSAIKSRAERNFIEFNFVADGARGSANYTLDLSAGGYALLVGNVLEKATHAEHQTVVGYAPESLTWQDNALFMAHNTLVNDRYDGNFITNHAAVELHAINNLFIGRGSIVDGGPVQLTGNRDMANRRYAIAHDDSLGGSPGSGHHQGMAAADIADRAQLHYQLTPNSAAIDTASPLPTHYPAGLTALWQYRHGADRIVRRQVGALADSGAFEFAAPYRTPTAATPSARGADLTDPMTRPPKRSENTAVQP